MGRQGADVNRQEQSLRSESDQGHDICEGWRVDKQPVASCDRGEYNHVDGEWTFNADMPIPSYGAGIVAASNGKIYVFGGHDITQGLDTDNVYDPALDSWATGMEFPAKMPYASNGPGAVQGNGGNIYVIGGIPQFGGGSSTVDVYDIDSDSWRPGLAILVEHHGFGTAKAANGRGYVVDGV